MRRLFAAALLVGGAVILAGCATRASIRQLETRLDSIGADVVSIRQHQEAAGREATPLLGELRTLTTRLQDTETRLREVGDKITELGSRVGAAEAALRQAIAAVEAVPRVAAVPAPPPERLVAERPRPAVTPAPADRTYAAAVATFRSGEHGQAVLELMDFIGSHPKHPLAPQAQLWIGEAYFKQYDYQQALVEYRKAIEMAPKSATAAEAWVKIGQAHAALRQRPAAASAWQRVVREHPGTEAAARARAFLAK